MAQCLPVRPKIVRRRREYSTLIGQTTQEQLSPRIIPIMGRSLPGHSSLQMADHFITIVEAVIKKAKVSVKLLLVYYLLIALHCGIVFSRSRLCELKTVRQRLEVILILAVVSGFLKTWLYEKLFSLWRTLLGSEGQPEYHLNHGYSALFSVAIGIVVPELQSLQEAVGNVFSEDFPTVLSDLVPARD